MLEIKAERLKPRGNFLTSCLCSLPSSALALAVRVAASRTRIPACVRCGREGGVYRHRPSEVGVSKGSRACLAAVRGYVGVSRRAAVLQEQGSLSPAPASWDQIRRGADGLFGFSAWFLTSFHLSGGWQGSSLPAGLGAPVVPPSDTKGCPSQAPQRAVPCGLKPGN